MIKNIALLTSDSEYKEHSFLIEALEGNGFKCSFVKWQEFNDVVDFDVVIFCCPFDYYVDFKGFSKWLVWLGNTDVMVLNPPNIILWNMDKRYLLDLQKNDVSIIPTCFIEKVTDTSLQECFDKFEYSSLILKPSISAGAYKTYKIDKIDIINGQRYLQDIINGSGCCLVQPYFSEIEKDGEWSLIFFNGVFSHAVLKKPQIGDFRVQKEYGGELCILEPEPYLIKQVEVIVSAIPDSEALFYARIDGLVVDGEFLLMEAELFEPELFFRANEFAVKNYITALKKLIV